MNDDTDQFPGAARSAGRPELTDMSDPGAGTLRTDRRSSILRRLKWPLPLFLLTCLSTFWVGSAGWQPFRALGYASQHGSLYLRQMVLEHWDQGLTYMLCSVGILLLHEMGHYVGTIIYRVPASLPFFLPFPFNPIGTLGAVIGMQGDAADRKQIFDIGIAGPLAGLVLAVPVAIIGVANLDLSPAPAGELGLRCPLLMQWLIRWFEIPGYEGQAIWLSQLNPYFTAAWAGLLITGLNMMPVGQLDGGHVTYTLFGRAAHRIADGIVILAVAFMVYSRSYVLVVMVCLLLLIGTEHPPTRNDKVPLGGFRWVLGLVSLTIPILCFPPLIFDFRT
jgi:membrane-associated protease RseP (regulator of RpoE activity)